MLLDNPVGQPFQAADPLSAGHGEHRSPGPPGSAAVFPLCLPPSAFGPRRAYPFVLTSYVIDAVFDQALASLREALTAAGLTISGEMDVADRIRRQLGLGFGPCRVLLVDSPYLLVEALALDRSAAALFPLHVVVFERGAATHVHWFNLAHMRHGLPAAAVAPLAKLQAQLTHALESVGRSESEWPVYTA